MVRQALLEAHRSKGAGWHKGTAGGPSSLIKASQELPGSWKRRKATFYPTGPSSAKKSVMILVPGGEGAS